MKQGLSDDTAVIPDSVLARAIAELARDATIEINVQDVNDLESSRAFLAAGKTIYVSHLPRQTWEQTEVACLAIHRFGFNPVPHVPVRLIRNLAMLDRILDSLVRAHVAEVLLVAGDYPAAVGPFASVMDVLRVGLLQQHGFRRISIAAHPEGHPQVSLQEIRRAEREKVIFATNQGLEVTLLTQFFFEGEPFIRWLAGLRSSGIRARVVAGLAGPASISTLLRFARRCGAGASIRVLSTRPTGLLRLSGHTPDGLVRELAQARCSNTEEFSGIHLFCFGGYLRTCEWLHEVTRKGFDREP
jgi:methylenetetrahydrofolate reductase (NADPH)